MNFLMVILSLIALLGCTKKSGSKFASSSMVIRGVVTDEAGKPIEGVKITNSVMKEVLGSTGGDGKFEFALVDQNIVNSKATHQRIKDGKYDGSFKLSFSTNREDLNLVGLSEGISYDFRGEKDLGKIVLKEASSSGFVIKSKGIVIEDGSGFAYSREVTVHIDVPKNAVAMRLSEDIAGFSKGLPYSEVASKTQFVFKIIRGESGENQIQETNLRELYCQFKIKGKKEDQVLYKAVVRLEPFPDMIDEEVLTINQGQELATSLMVNMDVKIPANAVEMRMFEEQVVNSRLVGGVIIEQDTRRILRETWFGVTDRIRFLFIEPGRHLVFLQFRDQDGLTSRMIRQSVFIKPFPPGAGPGFLINNGAPASISREVLIDLVPPPNAVSYRISENPQALNSLPFTFIEPSVAFVLNGTGVRRVFLQYSDIDEIPSETFVRDILVEPFPIPSGSILIDGGATTTSDRSVVLSIVFPPNAVQMRIADDINALSSKPFQVPQSSLNWFLQEKSGPADAFHQVYLQFKNETGDLSTIYRDDIEYTP